MFQRACSNHRLVLCALAIYVIAMAWLAPHFVFRLFPDSTSYFSVAKQYATGQTWDAINGYWSPLFSWLLVPFLWAGIAPHIASKVLFAVVGAAVVGLFHAFVGRLGVRRRIQNWATITSIPIIAYCSLTLATPDFLLVGLLLLYFFLLCRPQFASTRWSGALCGLVGGAAYLCKHYAIAFFAAHFTMFMLVMFLRGRREGIGRRVIFHYVAGMAVFVLICSAWIGAMSAKYGRFTVSQAGSYNHSLVGPHSTRSHRLRPPPNSHALSAWDNPAGGSQATQPWNPVASWNNFSRKLAQMARTTGRIGFALLGYTVIAPLIGAAGIFWALPAKVTPQVDRDGALFVLATMLIYISGYVLISVFDPRYFWMCWFLLLALAAIVLNRLEAATFFTPRRLTITLLLVSATFLVQPVYGIMTEINEGRDLYDMSQQLNSLQPFQGRLATLDRWRESLYLAYYLDVPYYGRTRPEASPQELVAELQEYEIDYLLEWHDYKTSEKDNSDRFSPPGRELTGGCIPHIRVFAQAHGWSGAVVMETKHNH